MWLLSTDRAELKSFPSPESVPKGYAILSHVWDAKEQTFQDTQRLSQQCATIGRNPRDLSSPKIRQFCVLAEYHGYQWAWVDTCCIDKTSSSELSEAINSMFRYYSLAEICYAYLRDVLSPLRGMSCESAFQKSRWHKRGWTLQELIAPDVVVFVSLDWKILGTKAEMAHQLQKITNIPAKVLTMETEATEISVAARMSWAANRQTTRPEDEAYCLMGIFGINMPTLYGEGRQAFRRLQEEIMKRSMDTSIYAWGDKITTDDLYLVVHDHADETYLLAPAPSAFRGCGDRHFSLPNPPTASRVATRNPLQRYFRSSQSELVPMLFAAANPVKMPTFTITSYGVSAHVGVIKWSYDLIIAVLFCADDSQQLGLLLSPCPDAPDPENPLYHTCFRFKRYKNPSGRLIRLGNDIHNIQLGGKRVAVEWKWIYLAHTPPPAAPSRMLMNRSISTPFRLPRWHIEELQRQSDVVLLTPTARALQFPWTGTPPATLRFRLRDLSLVTGTLEYAMYLGCCSGRSHSDVGLHWASLRPLLHRDADDAPPEHSCRDDHICHWPERTKVFMLRTRVQVRLSFTPCPINPDKTLVVNIRVVLLNSSVSSASTSTSASASASSSSLHSSVR